MSTLNVTRTRDRPPSGGVDLILPVDLRPLLGTWVNYDHTSTGIRRLHIEDWEATPVLRVFGAAFPEPVDWGEVAGAAALSRSWSSARTYCRVSIATSSNPERPRIRGTRRAN